MQESLEAKYSAPESQDIVEQLSDLKKLGLDRVNGFPVFEALGVFLDWEHRMRMEEVRRV